MAVETKSQLDREFFSRATEMVARDLVGCRLVSLIGGSLTAGTIVETEAYLGVDDLASHAAWLKSGRGVMAREPGTIYMYRSYGIHQMFNIVARNTKSEEHGAVLIRALAPDAGIEVMQARRKQESLFTLCSGPGKLCQAMAFDGDLHEVDIIGERSVSVLGVENRPHVNVGRRIGISRSVDLPLRFFATENPFVSRTRVPNLKSSGVTAT